MIETLEPVQALTRPDLLAPPVLAALHGWRAAAGRADRRRRDRPGRGRHRRVQRAVRGAAGRVGELRGRSPAGGRACSGSWPASCSRPPGRTSTAWPGAAGRPQGVVHADGRGGRRHRHGVRRDHADRAARRLAGAGGCAAVAAAPRWWSAPACGAEAQPAGRAAGRPAGGPGRRTASAGGARRHDRRRGGVPSGRPAAAGAGQDAEQVVEHARPRWAWRSSRSCSGSRSRSTPASAGRSPSCGRGDRSGGQRWPRPLRPGSSWSAAGSGAGRLDLDGRPYPRTPVHGCRRGTSAEFGRRDSSCARCRPRSASTTGAAVADFRCRWSARGCRCCWRCSASSPIFRRCGHRLRLVPQRPVVALGRRGPPLPFGSAPS